MSVERFRVAQDQPHAGFEAALAEIRGGGKRGHWIWYVFPQLAGLGRSSFSRLYALANAEEAVEYLRDPVLGQRLLSITTGAAEQLKKGVPIETLMGSDIDAQKLVSSLTLFQAVARKLYDSEPNEAHRRLGDVADEVLAMAASQGYERCGYTLAQLNDFRER